jgi:hypothetical protein
MNKIIFTFFLLIISNKFCLATENSFSTDNLFHIDQMDAHKKNFALFFKVRPKAVLAKGENSNYINDFPKDLYIHNYDTNLSLPLISYEWFPKQAQYLLREYDFPVFPDDFAYYLLKDDTTLVMVSTIKNINANFKFDINTKKLELYPSNGKLDFIISSIAKKCGYFEFDQTYNCSYYKPLISSGLIN